MHLGISKLLLPFNFGVLKSTMLWEIQGWFSLFLTCKVIILIVKDYGKGGQAEEKEILQGASAM